MAIAKIGIPSIAPFNAKGDPTSVVQRWEKRLKQFKIFKYFVDASGINNSNRKKALSTPTNATYKAVLQHHTKQSI